MITIQPVAVGGTNQSTLTIVNNIVRSSGYKGLYQGWLPSILRDCPFSAIYWLSFESLRPMYAAALGDKQTPPTEPKDIEVVMTHNSAGGGRREHSHQFKRPSQPSIPSVYTYSMASTFLAGASGGLLAALITHPFDVLKTQQQLEAYRCTTTTIHSSGGSGINLNSRKHLLDLSLIRRLGVSSMFSGLTMRLFTVIPASAIMVTIYETIKNMDI